VLLESLFGEQAQPLRVACELLLPGLFILQCLEDLGGDGVLLIFGELPDFL
jgi:hypothetical protein